MAIAVFPTCYGCLMMLQYSPVVEQILSGTFPVLYSVNYFGDPLLALIGHEQVTVEPALLNTMVGIY